MVEGFTDFRSFETSCLFHAPEIFVRALVEGKWESVALSEVSDQTKRAMIQSWWDRGHSPIRIVR